MLSNISDIAAVDGVNGILLGLADLAADYGHLANPAHPDVKAAIVDGIRRIRETGKVAGMSASENDAEGWFTQGCGFVSVGGDINLLVRHSRLLAKKFAHIGTTLLGK